LSEEKNGFLDPKRSPDLSALFLWQFGAKRKARNFVGNEDEGLRQEKDTG